MRRAPFVVSLVSDLRPMVDRLNRELARRRAGPVRRDELEALDDLLHDVVLAGQGESGRCRRCGGYVYGDGSGEQACLNCGRPAGGGLALAEVEGRLAGELVRRRRVRRRSRRSR